MKWLVLRIVGDFYEQNGIVKKVHVPDWTAELAIIALLCPFNNTEKVNVLSAMGTGVNCFFD